MSHSDSQSRPANRSSGLYYWLYRGSLLRLLFVFVVAMITLGFLYYAASNWSGQRAWQVYKHDLESKGIVLSWKAVIPPPVPDAQNFAMTPVLAPLFDFNPMPLQEGHSRWRDTNAFQKISSFGSDLPAQPGVGWAEGKKFDLGEWMNKLRSKKKPGASTNSPASEYTEKSAATAVLQTLNEFNPILDELREASHRPYARFNIRYEEDSVWGILLPHLAVVKRASFMLELRSLAELKLGQNDAAFEDLKLSLHLANSIVDEPFTISHLVRIAMLTQTLQVIWEGCAERRWSDAQLREIEGTLAKVDLIAGMKRSVETERAAGNLTIEQIREAPARTAPLLSDVNSGLPMALFLVAPRGWFYREQISLNQEYDDYFLPLYDPEAHRINPEFVAKKGDEFNHSLGDSPLKMALHHKLFSSLLLPAMGKASQKAALGQTSVDEARVACALERYRLAHGRYADTLAALTPDLLAEIPHDICTGDPLKYRLSANGQFVLYSVGWNMKDDGGVTALTDKEKHRDLIHGDWVWEYPGN